MTQPGLSDCTSFDCFEGPRKPNICMRREMEKDMLLSVDIQKNYEN